MLELGVIPQPNILIWEGEVALGDCGDRNPTENNYIGGEPEAAALQQSQKDMNTLRTKNCCLYLMEMFCVKLCFR